MGRWEKIIVCLFILIAVAALTVAAKAQFLQCKPECGGLNTNGLNDDWCANNTIDDACADTWVAEGNDYKIADMTTAHYLAPTDTDTDADGTYLFNPPAFRVYDRGWVAACGTFAEDTYILSLKVKTTDINPVVYLYQGDTPPAVPDVTAAVRISETATKNWNRSDTFANPGQFIKYIREDEDDTVTTVRDTYALGPGAECFWLLPVNTKIYGAVLMNNAEDDEETIFTGNPSIDYTVLEVGAAPPDLTDGTCNDASWTATGVDALTSVSQDPLFHASGMEVRMLWKNNASGNDTLYARYRVTDDLIVDNTSANDQPDSWDNDAFVILHADDDTNVVTANTCKAVVGPNGYHSDYKFNGTQQDINGNCVTAAQKATDVTGGWCVEVEMTRPATTPDSLNTMAIIFNDKTSSASAVYRAVPFGLYTVGSAINDLAQSTAFNAKLSSATIEVDNIDPVFVDAPDDCTVTPSATEASVSCEISEEASCVVDYGLSQGELTSHTTPVDSQFIGGSHYCISLVPELVQATTYYYQMNAEDRAGNTGTSTAGLNFTTLTEPQVPVVTLAAHTNVTHNSAQINFSVDQNTDCLVRYDTDDDGQVSEPVFDPEADPPQPEEDFDMEQTPAIDCTGSCSITLTGLNPVTLYEYQADCTLKNGALTGSSAVSEFTTLQLPNVFKRTQPRDWNVMCRWSPSDPFAGANADDEIALLASEDLTVERYGYCDGFVFPWTYDKATVAKDATGSTVQWVFSEFGLGGLEQSAAGHDKTFFDAKPTPDWQLHAVGAPSCDGDALYIKSQITAALMDYGSVGDQATVLDTTRYVDAWISEVITNAEAKNIDGIWGGQCRPWVSAQYVNSAGVAKLPCNPRTNLAYTMDQWNTDWVNALARIKYFFDQAGLYFVCNSIGAFWPNYETTFLYDPYPLGGGTIATPLKEGADHTHAIEIEDFSMGFSAAYSATQWQNQMSRIEDMLANKVAVPVLYQTQGKTSTKIEFFREASLQLIRPLTTSGSMTLLHPIPGEGVDQVSDWWASAQLGIPDTPRYQVGTTSLWARAFPNGLVVVNPATVDPTPAPTIDLGTDPNSGQPLVFTRVKTGAQVSGPFTVKAGEGEIFIGVTKVIDIYPPDFLATPECTTPGTIGTTSVSIKCQISEDARCRALYSTTQGSTNPTVGAWSNSITDTDGKKYCSFSVTSLSANTKYYYKVEAEDFATPAPNLGITDSEYNFTTATVQVPPTVTWNGDTQVTPTSHKVSFTPSQGAKCQVKYEADDPPNGAFEGTPSIFPASVPANNNCTGGTQCDLTINTGLTAATSYDALATCTNENGTGDSAFDSFTTKSTSTPPDVDITGITGVGDTYATVNFNVTKYTPTISSCTVTWEQLDAQDCAWTQTAATKTATITTCSNAGNCSYTMSGLTKLKKYSVSVNCEDSDGRTDPQTECGKFTTGDTPPYTAGCPDPPQTGGKEYWISPDGNDTTNDGGGTTSQKPWKTWGYAIPKLSPGDTLIAMDGVWTNFSSCADAKNLAAYPYFKSFPGGDKCLAKIPLIKINCGTAGAQNGLPNNWIRIKAQNERQAMLIGNGTNLGAGAASHNGALLKMENCEYWQIEGLRGTMADRSDAQTYLGWDGQTMWPGATIHNFMVSNSNHLTFCRNILHHNNQGNNGSHLLQLGPAVSSTLTLENEMWDFLRHGIAYSSTGQGFNVARRNYTNSRPTTRQCGEGIAFYGSMYNTMENNVNEGCDAGTSVAREDPIGNVAVGNMDYASSSQGIYGGWRWDKKPYQNTLFIDNVALKSGNGMYGGFFIQGMKNPKLYNNSSFGNAGSGFWAKGSPGDGAQKDYNMSRSPVGTTDCGDCPNGESCTGKHRTTCCNKYDCLGIVKDRPNPRCLYPDTTVFDSTLDVKEDYDGCPANPATCNLENAWPAEKEWDNRASYYNLNALAGGNGDFGFKMVEQYCPGWWMVENSVFYGNAKGNLQFGWTASDVATTDTQCDPQSEPNQTEFYGNKCYDVTGAYSRNGSLTVRTEGCCMKDVTDDVPTKMWNKSNGQGCIVYIPGGAGGGKCINSVTGLGVACGTPNAVASTMANAGKPWGRRASEDIGANIIYRYETPVGSPNNNVSQYAPLLTTVPLWATDPAKKGAFPCGAPVSKVNDQTYPMPGGAPAANCYNIQQRFNVGYNGCPHPITGDLY